jgi:hypothetical protein
MKTTCVAGVLFFAVAAGAAAAPRFPVAAPPGAADFADVLVSTTNAYAGAHADRSRIAHADCVEAARGRYMCSYKAITANGRVECHLMQAKWTPWSTSSFTVTLAGRVKRCANLRQALRSLG